MDCLYSNVRTKHLILLVGMFFWIVCLRFNWQGSFGQGDHLSYALIARNIALGRGIQHSTISSHQLIELGKFPEIDIGQPIGWPIIEAAFFYVFGANDWVIVMASGIFWWFGLWLLLEISEILFSETVLGSVGILYLLYPSLLRLSTSGLTEPLFIFLWLFWIFMTLRFRKLGFCSGLITGAMLLTRFATLFWLPAMAWLLWKTNKGPRYLTKWLIGLGVVVFLEFIRRVNAGHQVFAETNSLSLPLRLGSFKELFLANIVSSYGVLILTFSFLRESKRKTNTATIYQDFVRLSLILILLGQLVSFIDPRYVVPVLVLIIPVSAYKLAKLRWSAQLAAFLLVTLLLITAVKREYFARATNPCYQKMSSLLTNKKKYLVASQVESVAWYFNTRVVQAPETEEELKEIEKIIPIQDLILSKKSSLNQTKLSDWTIKAKCGDGEMIVTYLTKEHSDLR